MRLLEALIGPRRPVADTLLDQHVAMLRKSVERCGPGSAQLDEKMKECHKAALAIRKDNADVASLRQHPGWLKLEAAMVVELQAKVMAEHGLALTNPQLCRENACRIDEMLYLLNMCGSAFDQHDRAAEIVKMGKAQLLRYVRQLHEPEEE